MYFTLRGTKAHAQEKERFDFTNTDVDAPTFPCTVTLCFFPVSSFRVAIRPHSHFLGSYASSLGLGP